MKQSKVWGTTSLLLSTPNFEVHRIEVNKGGYCSKHFHQYKFNVFYIEKGKLKILVYQEDSKLVDETIVSSGESTTIEPNEYHRFEALEDTIAYEIYYVTLPSEDIIREDHGGIIK